MLDHPRVVTVTMAPSGLPSRSNTLPSVCLAMEAAVHRNPAGAQGREQRAGDGEEVAESLAKNHIPSLAAHQTERLSTTEKMGLCWKGTCYSHGSTTHPLDDFGQAA